MNLCCTIEIESLGVCVLLDSTACYSKLKKKLYDIVVVCLRLSSNRKRYKTKNEYMKFSKLKIESNINQ